MSEENNIEEEQAEITEESFELATKLLDAAKIAEIQDLEESETQYLADNGMIPAKYYKLLATIDLDHNDNRGFRQGIMLLVDTLTHVQEKHPEILVAGEDEEHAEVQLVAETKEALEDIPYEDAGKFLVEAKERLSAA